MRYTRVYKLDRNQGIGVEQEMESLTHELKSQFAGPEYRT